MVKVVASTSNYLPYVYSSMLRTQWWFGWSLGWQHGLVLIPSWIRNYSHFKVCNETTYPFSNFNGTVVEVWERISDFITQFVGHVITYSCWGSSESMLIKIIPERYAEISSPSPCTRYRWIIHERLAAILANATCAICKMTTGDILWRNRYLALGE